MHYRALIPVKSLHEAKSRLAPYLSLEQRGQLVLTMLRHVLLVLQESDIATTVVSPDAQVRTAAHAWGSQVFEEEQAGHNPALEAATKRILALETVSDIRNIALLILSADLPLLQVDEVQGMLDAARHCDVVLAASQEGTGTNALLVHPPLALLPYQFGPNSLQQHLAAARQHHLSAAVYKRHGLSFDIDTIDDVELLQMYAWEYRATQSNAAYGLASLA